MFVTRAPGRVNLIGDHTDYQDGWCLPMAIDREVRIAVEARTDNRVVARSHDLDGVVDVPADGRTALATVEPAWGRTVAAVLAVLTEHGRDPIGFDATITSTIPVGSGLSSSAAFEVAVALSAAHVAGVAPDRRDLALVAQEAEHRATGVPCGVMDQMASVFGAADQALLLDCRTLDVTPVAVPPTVDVLVVHSGVARRLEESAYARRRAACEQAAARLGVAALRDASLDDVRDDPMARHVVSENARVLACVDALRTGDVQRAGELMLESHASLRDDFAVSIPELDRLVEQLHAAGAYGARLTGAGFGGCAVALVPAGAGPDIARAGAAGYRAFVVRACAGATVESEE